LGQAIATARFTAGSVNARTGPGFDNIIWIKGINHNATGGGDSIGFDYIALNVTPQATFPWAVGRDDNSWPFGNGGGPNTSFVQETGVNPLPGRPNNPEAAQQGDDDYYFAGEYTTTIPGVVALHGAYTPLGLVLANEEGAERAFAGNDNTKRYHFNLPDSVGPDDLLFVTFDANNLDQQAINPDPRYGVEIYFNGVLVQSQIVIRAAQLGIDYTTAGFTAASVNAQVGPGFDNVVTLKGINYNNDGGGNWMGIDYVQLNPQPQPIFPWAVGRDDNAWQPISDGGGANAAFVQENGIINPLPGGPTYLGAVETGTAQMGGDNDYYFGGQYTTTISSVVDRYGAYTPPGLVAANEGAAERAFANDDNDLRYHFNLPSTLGPDDVLSVTFDALNLHTDPPVTDGRYGIEVYFNGVLVQTQIVIRPAQLGIDYTTPSFTLASVNAQTGPGFDNIVSLRGVSYAAEGGGSWMGIDYVQLNEGRPQFRPATVSGGMITLNWIGGGSLYSAPTVSGPWTHVQGAQSGYSEAVVPGQNRFYRLERAQQ